MSAEDNATDSIRHVAAVDLGSNSFHMLVVRILHDDLQPLFKYKERVRLAEGLDDQNRLTDEAIQRGVSVLKNFAEQLAPLESCTIRVVATHTLRVAANRRDFLREAAQVFPYQIEVVSGQEEARLVYLGVAETEQLSGNTLVIDIGGGSTEIVVGADGEMVLGRSLAMGCVSFTKNYFSNGIDKKSYKLSRIAAQQAVERFVTSFKSQNPKQVRVTSGTAQGISTACENLGLEPGIINGTAIREIRDVVLAGDLTSSKIFKGISPERLGVFTAGLAIMDALVEILGIDQAVYSTGALREGVLREERKVEAGTDTRTRSIQSLVTRYHVDLDQAQRVQATALRFWDQLAPIWNLRTFTRKYLGFAALTHEVGLNINASGQHKHSAYIIENSNLSGFSFEQQQLVAAMVRQYRKRLRLELLPSLQLVSNAELLGLVLILRLAVIWHINRHPEAPELPLLKAKEASLNIELPESYAESYPLLVADLEREAETCSQAGIELKLTLV